MSRGYRVRMALSTSNTTVTAQDHYRIQLSLMGILPQEEMVELLREVLVEAGWQRHGTQVRRVVNGVMERLAEDGSYLELSAQDQESISVTGAGTNKEAAQLEAKRLSEKESQQALENLKRQLTVSLAQREPDARAQMQEAIQQVYLRALQRKAAQLGEIESQEETRGADGEYELTIRIRV